MTRSFITGARLFLAFGFISAVSGIARADARSQLQQDVEGYAVATCLTAQNSDYLKDQGDGWASIIVQRGYGDVEDWQPLIDAVNSALKDGSVAVIKGDGTSSKQMPVFYCAEIIDQPKVRSVVDATMEKMKAAYEGR
ncbi:hypothetical protein RMR10_009205 [Agrobacterium rosae]|uniref:hypothetical protein n=1 Tax=Agrobacterium rosae TaxID=1972867 RepID=UPI002A1566FB|nr:hypothetical protein [Agrobacterium rosae]MDX8315742.1 hypothetical protein [Agrobacterium rosae]